MAVTCLAVGYTTGSALGAYLLRNPTDMTAVLRLALILIALLSLYVYVVPESLRRVPLVQPHSDNESEQGHNGGTHGQRSSETSHRWKFRRIFDLMKECLAMMTYPIAFFLPNHIPTSNNIARSEVPMLILPQTLWPLWDSVVCYPTLRPPAHVG